MFVSISLARRSHVSMDLCISGEVVLMVGRKSPCIHLDTLPWHEEISFFTLARVSVTCRQAGERRAWPLETANRLSPGTDAQIAWSWSLLVLQNGFLVKGSEGCTNLPWLTSFTWCPLTLVPWRPCLGDTRGLHPLASLEIANVTLVLVHFGSQLLHTRGDAESKALKSMFPDSLIPDNSRLRYSFITCLITLWIPPNMQDVFFPECVWRCL